MSENNIVRINDQEYLRNALEAAMSNGNMLHCDGLDEFVVLEMPEDVRATWAERYKYASVFFRHEGKRFYLYVKEGEKLAGSHKAKMVSSYALRKARHVVIKEEDIAVPSVDVRYERPSYSNKSPSNYARSSKPFQHGAQMRFKNK